MADTVKISIHALRAEGDRWSGIPFVVWAEFLSTPSVRRATPEFPFLPYFIQFLSTPSVRRATRCLYLPR